MRMDVLCAKRKPPVDESTGGIMNVDKLLSHLSVMLLAINVATGLVLH